MLIIIFIRPWDILKYILSIGIEMFFLNPYLIYNIRSYNLNNFGISRGISPELVGENEQRKFF